MWVAILCATGGRFAFAQPYDPAMPDYGRYTTPATTPGMRQSAPAAPPPVARPEHWPGSAGGVEAAGVEAGGGAPPPGQSLPVGAMSARPFIGAHVVARVGKEIVTVRDVLSQVPTIVERNRGRIPDEALAAQQEALAADLGRAIEEAFARQNGSPDQLVIQSEQLRAQMLDQVLRSQIQTLLVFLDAQRNIPAEGLPEVRRQIDEGFEKQVVPGLLKRAGAGSRRELDDFLRSQGTSLEREKRMFFQQTLAQQWVRQHVNFEEKITHEEMLEYYRNHPDEFDQGARTTWDQLCVQFVDQPSDEAAYAAIATLGNRVLAGEPFAEVAKDASQGPTASEGGRRVWPDERHLSEELENAIHGLPVGQLSPIVRDWQGLHIVRVVERTPAGRLPFEAVQEDIRSKIKEERVQKQIEEYVRELKRRTSVWTVLDL